MITLKKPLLFKSSLVFSGDFCFSGNFFALFSYFIKSNFILGGVFILKTAFLPLSKSEPNKTYKILSINCKGQIKRRLFDLGIIPGTFIKNIQNSPLGDPTAFLVRGTVIAIRKEDTKKIVVESI